MEKNLSGLLYKKKLSASKATCPESIFKTVQIILWETPVTKSSRKVFKMYALFATVINNQLGILL